jgi:hypothetical protein
MTDSEGKMSDEQDPVELIEMYFRRGWTDGVIGDVVKLLKEGQQG